MSSVFIQMMGSFRICLVNGEVVSHKLKSRKGSLLIQHLVLNYPNPVSSEALIDALSLNRTSDNPQNALKTLVSRTRALLNEILPSLESLIMSKRGSYFWKLLPGVSVDVCELENIFSEISRKRAELPENEYIYERVIELYAGDLYSLGENPDWFKNRREELRKKYLSAVCDYLAHLESLDETDRIINICRTALAVDERDRRIRKYLIDALEGDGGVMADPVESFGASVQNLNRMLDKKTVDIIDALASQEQSPGPFICAYDEFNDICDLTLSQVERSGAAMFIALIGVSARTDAEFDSLRINELSHCLVETLAHSLRKGDTVTQLAPLTYAVSLPMVDYATSCRVLERLKESFYERNALYKDALLSFITQPFTRHGGNI